MNIPVILCLDEEFFYHVRVSRPNIFVQTNPKSKEKNQIKKFQAVTLFLFLFFFDITGV
jgi:hypothetical protein